MPYDIVMQTNAEIQQGYYKMARLAVGETFDRL